MTSILIFLLVLSFLVFFHEMGHFLAAKACNIYVDRFSIGMPPRVAGFQWGETDYCIGALPIGGYVKMAGQEDAPLSDEEREKEYGSVPPERWFNNKPVWQRIFVLLAGPFANLVLAVILFGVLAGIGEELPKSRLEPRIGHVDANYPAATAKLYSVDEGQEGTDLSGEPDAIGWKPGDMILLMNGAVIDNILPDLATNALLHGEGTPHTFLLERTAADGSTTRFLCELSPQRAEGDEFPRFGVEPFESVYIAEVHEDSPAADAGLREGDVIRRANGDPVDQTTFINLTQDMPEGEPLDLLVERDGEMLSLAMATKTIGKLKSARFSVPPDTEDLDEAPAMVIQIDEAFKEKTGLQRKDRITAVNGEKIGFNAFHDVILNSPGESLTVNVERPSILFGLLQRREELTLDLPVDAARAIGISISQETAMHRFPLSEIVPEAFRRSYRSLANTLLTLKALVMRDVGLNELGGPVMIYQVTADAASMGLGRLIFITAFISINLCVFNLLPLPVLDGGQILINSIEGIRRKPVSMVVMERYQTVGLVLIIGLMLYVTWNDVGRLITNMLP